MTVRATCKKCGEIISPPDELCSKCRKPVARGFWRNGTLWWLVKSPEQRCMTTLQQQS